MDYYIGGADVITRVLIRERGRQGCQTEGEEVGGGEKDGGRKPQTKGGTWLPAAGKGQEADHPLRSSGKGSPADTLILAPRGPF